jgi:phosphoribosylformylglycinamidine synthase
MYREVGDVALVPVSHGEGRFVCNDELLSELIAKGQIATQYCNDYGMPSMNTAINPNGSVMAIEGITSPDGRVFGKMAHSERCGKNLYKNVPGPDDFAIFRGAVDYFKK